MEEALCDEIVDQSNDIPGPLFNLIFTEDKEKQVSLDAWYTENKKLITLSRTSALRISRG